MEINKEVMLLMLLKALADESRMALLRLLNEGERTVGDLAIQVNLGEPTVSHHLTRMRKVGLVTLRMAGNQRFYRVNQSGLALFKQLAAEIEHIQPIPEASVSDDGWINAMGWDEADLQILREYTHDGKLTNLPPKQKKMQVVLRWLATMFENDRLYSEKEINTILKTIYAEDYISLRRDLVDMGYLRRERNGGTYWLGAVPEEKNNS